MLLIVTTSIMIISLCIVLHYSRHFRCQSCNAHRPVNRLTIKSIFSSDGRSNSITKTRLSLKTPLEDALTFRFHWCCTTNSDEEFDFFPLSFLLYMIYILLLSCLILFKYIHEETASFNTYYYNDTSYHIHNISINKLTFNHPSSMNLLSYLDWIIYILIIFAMIWESLFGYYRYYTTISSAKFCESFSFIDIFKHFVVYMFAYTLLFIIQTQIYYLLFPIVILVYFSINLYWIYKSTSVIIRSVEQMNGLNNRFDQSKLQNDLLYNVRLLRTFSSLSTIFSCIYISTFIVIYNIKIVYYLPPIWCFSILNFACVFIRNRKFITRKLCCCFLSSIKNNPVLALLTTRSSELPQTQLAERRSTFETFSVNDLNGEFEHNIKNDNEKFVVCVEYIDEGNEPVSKTDCQRKLHGQIHKQMEYKPKTDQIQIKIDNLDTFRSQKTNPISSPVSMTKSEHLNDKIDTFRSQKANPISSPVSMNIMDDGSIDIDHFDNIKASSTGDLMNRIKNNNKNESDFVMPAASVTKNSKNLKTPQSVPAYITNMMSHSYQFIFNKKKKIKTPQSMNVITTNKITNNKKKLLGNNLSLELYDMSSLDEDNSVNSVNMNTKARESITPRSKTQTQTQTETNISVYKKPMSKLLLPNLKNRITTMRSSSNPLLKSQIEKMTPIESKNDTMSEMNDDKYDLFSSVMTPSVQTNTYCAGDQQLTPHPGLKDVNSNPTPEPKQHLDVISKHRHSTSANDINKVMHLKTFTLMDAIVEMRNDPSNSAVTVKSEGVTPYNYKKKYDFKANVKRKRGFSDYNGRKQQKKKSKHIHEESVASVVNLIVAQGLYDKKRAKRILKTAYI